MTLKKHLLPAFLLLTTLFADAQKLKKEDRQVLANLQQHISFLADDKLEGRRTGTEGEATAARYIAGEFEKAGLTPAGTNGFFQAFEINEGKQMNPGTSLMINGQALAAGKDFFPLSSSPNITIEALPSMALQEPGMPWFFDLKEAIINSTKEVKRKGATAVFLYNTSGKDDGMKFNGREHADPLPIPVIYI